MQRENIHFIDLKQGDLLMWHYRVADNAPSEILLFLMDNDDVTIFFSLTEKRLLEFRYAGFMTGKFIARF